MNVEKFAIIIQIKIIGLKYFTTIIKKLINMHIIYFRFYNFYVTPEINNINLIINFFDVIC